MQPEKMLPFATQVVSKLVCSIQVFEVTKLNVKSKKAYSQFCGWLQAACSCRALGARTGLPHHTDPRLAPFLRQTSWAMSRATRERNGIRFYNLVLFFSSHLSVVGSSSCVLNGGRWWNGQSCVGFSLSFLVKKNWSITELETSYSLSTDFDFLIQFLSTKLFSPIN